MIKSAKHISTNDAGAAAVEFALAAPLFLLMVYGVMQLGQMYLNNAALRNAVEAGARRASYYVPPPGVADQNISDAVAANYFGLDSSQLVGPKIIRGTANGSNYIDVTLSYNQSINFVFFQFPAITLTETRRTYVP